MPGAWVGAVTLLAMGWVLDLDGVVWLAHRAIDGAPGAVARLRQRGHQVLFVTNNAQATVGEVGSRLAAIGIDPAGDVLTSAMAVARLVEPGECVLAVAGPGVVEALHQRGARVVAVGDTTAVTAVVVGKHHEFSYASIRHAARAVRDGARLLATNTDPTYPTPDGLDPGAGALVAAVATAAGRPPDAVAGKPHETMAAMVRERLGPTGVVVGDVAATDGLFARRLGYRFVQVLTGVTPAGGVDPGADVVASSLAVAVEHAVG